MQHIPGQSNVIADWLSRLQVKKPEISSTVTTLQPTTNDCPPFTLAHLIPDMQHYFQSALAPSTLCTYNSGLQSYLTFCRQSHLLPFPLTESHLEFFITSIARRLAYLTIKVYLCGLQYDSIYVGIRSGCQTCHSYIIYLEAVVAHQAAPSLVIHVHLLRLSSCIALLLFTALIISSPGPINAD